MHMQIHLHPDNNQHLETRTRRQKIFSLFKDRKEWVKLNASYLVATSANFGTALATAHIAQRAGISKESATTWLSFISGFTVGFGAMVVTWYFLHVDKYQKDLPRIATDAWTMFKNIWKAQAVSIAVTIPVSWFLTNNGISTTLVVTLQQIADRLLFIPAFNFFSHSQVKEMEK